MSDITPNEEGKKNEEAVIPSSSEESVQIVPSETPVQAEEAEAIEEPEQPIQFEPIFKAQPLEVVAQSSSYRSAIASQSTGLNISVGRLALRFPLDLVVSDVLAVDTLKNDTLLSLERLKVELRFWKLLKKEIEIEEISIRTHSTIGYKCILPSLSLNILCPVVCVFNSKHSI